MKRFNYTYLIYCNDLTSSLYGCIYYGKHSTDDLNDGYIASGIKIRKYIKKYPNGYYRKILNFYDSLDELNKAEYDLIHPHLGQQYCLNLREGGEGGGTKWSDERKKRMSQLLKGHTVTEETREKIRQANKGRIFSEEQRYSFGNGNRGKHNTETQKIKISQKLKGKKSPIKGKHKVWDNKELKKFHYE